LELCLKSVEAAISGLEGEIIVVDNNSSDDSCAMVKSLFPNVQLIENKVNYGFSKGNNQGVTIAKGEYICILNPDTFVAEDTFSTLLNFAETIDNLGVLGCRLMDGGGSFLPESKRNVPVPKIALKKLLGFPNDYYANQIGEFEIGEVPIFAGAFMIIKKSVFDQVNGFDEDYFMYGDDIDLSYRILKHGYHNYYNGNVTVLHFKGESTLKDKTYVKQFYGAMQVFYEKHFKQNPLYNLAVWIGIRIALVLRPEPKDHKTETEQYILVSEKLSSQLKTVLQKPVQLFSETYDVNEKIEFILDANTNPYKFIVEFISNPKYNGKAKFKILPRKSSFIIGSDSSISRGEVIKLNDN